MSADDSLAELQTQLLSLAKTREIKPILDQINEFAHSHSDEAPLVTNAIFAAIANECSADKRIAFFYLFDSLSKNRRIAALYRPLIAAQLHTPFVKTYQHASESVRKLMDKTLRAWHTNEIFDAKMLDDIENASHHSLSASTSTTKKRPSFGNESASSSDPRNKRIKSDGPRLSPQPQQTLVAQPLTLEMENTLSALSESLRPFPQLLPMLHHIQTTLRAPGADMNGAAPMIDTLTSALAAALAAAPPSYQLPVQAPMQPLYPPVSYTPPTHHYYQPQQQPHYSYQSQALTNHLHPPQYPQLRQPRASPQPVNNQPLQPKTFDTEDLKTRDAIVISALYDKAGQQCQTCGFRLSTQEAMSGHLDYHFKLNRRESKRASLRSAQSIHQQWYWTETEWIESDDVIFGKFSAVRDTDDESDDSDNDSDDESDASNARSVIADDSMTVCPICLQTFETYWNDVEESWMYRGTVLINSDLNDDKAFIKVCGSDNEASKSKRVAFIDEFNGQILHFACAAAIVAENNSQPALTRINHTDDYDSNGAAIPPLEAATDGGGQ